MPRYWVYDWNSFPGKPAGLAPQVQTDWNAVSGMGVLLNKPTLATVATSGSYNDLSNKPPIPAAPSISTPSRALNTIYQLSATRNAWVAYSVQIVVTASIGSGQAGDAILEAADDAGFTSNVRTIAIVSNAQVVTLAIALQSVQTSTATLAGYIPAAAYHRIRTVNVTGAPGFSIRAQQETLL